MKTQQLLLLLCCAGALAQDKPPVVRAFQAGSPVIEGELEKKTEVTEFQVRWCNAPGCSRDELLEIQDKQHNKDLGPFRLTLRLPLQPGFFKVCAGTKLPAPCSRYYPVGDPTAIAAPVLTSFKAESATLEGRLIPDNGPATFLVSGCESDCAAIRLIGVSAQKYDWQRGDFTLTLAQPLKPGFVTICGGTGPQRPCASYPVADGDMTTRWIDIDSELPIREGREKLAGKVGPEVKRVRILVMSPAPPPRNGEPQKEEKAQERAETPGTVSRQLREFFQKEFDKQRATSAERVGSPAPDPAAKKDDSTAAAPAERTQAENAAGVGCTGGEIEQVMDVAVDKQRFETAFERPIDAGQCIAVSAVTETGTAYPKTAKVVYVTPAYADWGRVRGTFIGGTALGNAGATTSADPYVAFRVDGTLFNINLVEKDADRIGDYLEFRNTSLSLHFFNEGRVTQAPQSGSSTSVPVQALSWQAGFYAPIRGKGLDWQHKGSRYTFFAAPLVKYGAFWLKDGIIVRQTLVSRIADKGETTGVAIPAETKTTNVFNTGARSFWGYGARFGFLKYTLLGTLQRNRQMSPDLIGYFDFVYGKNHALLTPRSPRETEKTDTSTTNVIDFYTQKRWMIEARVKLPSLPITIGADVSQAAASAGASPTELRFVLGVRLDAAEAIGRVFQQKK